MIATAFPAFPKLPEELRHMVWRAALPADDTPAMYVCDWRWYLRSLDVTEGEDEIRQFEGVERQPKVRVTLAELAALALTNHEAHRVAERWKDDHGISLKRLGVDAGDENGGGSGGTGIGMFSFGCNVAQPAIGSNSVFWRNALVRDWRPETDSLFVPRHEWEAFVRRLCNEDVDEEAALGPQIWHLALPAFTAYYSVTSIATLLDCMPNLRAIHAVWDDLPSRQPLWDMHRPSTEDELETWKRRITRRWELHRAGAQSVETRHRSRQERANEAWVVVDTSSNGRGEVDRVDDDDDDEEDEESLDKMNGTANGPDEACNGTSSGQEDGDSEKTNEDTGDDGSGGSSTDDGSEQPIRDIYSKPMIPPDSNDVFMTVIDPTTHKLSYQVGDLYEWMDEIHDEWAVAAVPAQFVESETGELLFELVGSKAVTMGSR